MFSSSMYSIIHECGHALFELNQPSENHDHFLEHKTMGAWALEIFEAIPERGDRFERGHLRVTVKELSNNRITLLRVEVLERGEQKTEN